MPVIKSSVLLGEAHGVPNLEINSSISVQCPKNSLYAVISGYLFINSDKGKLNSSSSDGGHQVAALMHRQLMKEKL